jgi:predicted metal-dependent phosphoesterase TrpH
MDPKTILNVAKHVKLDAIAITDHNTIAGAIATRKIREKNSIIVIVGSEISTDLGDVIGIFLNEEIKSRNVYDVIDEIKSQDGLVLIPHPFKTKSILQIKGIIDHVDLLEGYNSRHPITSEQLIALKAMNKPIVAGSDAHFPQEIGLSRTIVHYEFELDNEEDARRALLHGTIEISGSLSPFYLEPLSQIIKGLKRKDLKLIGWGALNLIRYKAKF